MTTSQRCAAFLAILALAVIVSAQQRQQQPPPIQPRPEELAAVQAKTKQIDEVLAALPKSTDASLRQDVEIYSKAGKMLLEFPEDFFTQDGINHAMAVLDTGIERAKQLQSGEAKWTSGRKRLHGFRSDLDGSVQPYGVTLPESYDPSKPARLYVWMHGRAARLTESEFLFAFPNSGPGKPPVADAGQIQMDVYGRWNGGGWHYAGERDVFEAIDAVSARYKIDPDRILLRGFSMGGEGAWHIALHHPDAFAAAEIGAGTWSRRSETPGLTDYQLKTLRIWENMHEWALNGFNLPIAGHDGDNDTQVCCLPPDPQRTKTRGQLESSLKVRDQLVKEGFPAEGEPNDLRIKGTPSIFLISENTGHGTSPLVRQQLDAFLKQYGDRGRLSPDHIRFVTFTTRYNHDYWVAADNLKTHYERTDIDAVRSDRGKHYKITTKNLARLTLRETDHASTIEIDGQQIKVKPASSITLENTNGQWRQAKETQSGLHKIHRLQGPIDDAFLDPFVCVKPTGTPWNEAVNEQSLRALARFDRLYAKFFRAHPRIVNDKDLRETDFARFNVVLFGDPGSNRWIAKLQGKLPVRWTRESVSMGSQSFPAASHYPVFAYPNPFARDHYVVLNTGLTISEREYRGDYGMPRLGDFAILKVTAPPNLDVPEAAYAGLFDEDWQLPQGK